MARHANLSVVRSSVVALLVAVSASTVLISARGSDASSTADDGTDTGGGREPPPGHRADPDRRSALRHALGDADGAIRARGERHRVLERLRLQSRVLPEPFEHPHRSVLALDRCLHEPPEGAVRGVPGVPRLVDRGDVAPRGRVPHRVARQVPERVRRLIRPARLGPLVRDLGRRRVLRLHGERRRGPAVLRVGPAGLRHRRAGRSGDGLHPIDRAGPAAVHVLRAARGPRARHSRST